MRRLKWIAGVSVLLAAPLLASSCKHAKRGAIRDAPGDGRLASVVNADDPLAAVQFVRGFYDVDEGHWRWTARQFLAVLRPPATASARGARLVFRFDLPAAVVDRLGSVTLSASVNDQPLAPRTYTQPGACTYARDVSSDALRDDAVPVSFTLDKALPPANGEIRELGVIALSVGLEEK